MELSFLDELKGVAACCEHEATEKRLNALIAKLNEPEGGINADHLARIGEGQSADIQHFVNLEASPEPEQKSANCMPCGGWGVIAAEPGDPETKCEHCDGIGKDSAKPEQPFPSPKFTVTNLDGKQMGQALLDFGKRLVDGNLTWVSGGVWLHASEGDKLVLSTCGSDLVVKSAACCTPTAEELQLLTNGEYRPEELWGGDRPTCPKCFGKPASEGEVNHYQLITNLTAIIDQELMPHAYKLPIQDFQRLNETLMEARKVLK